MKFLDYDVNFKVISPLDLAFIGDCIFEMLVREKLVCEANRSVADLHRESVKYVNAEAQCEAYEKIKQYLTEEEMKYFKAGRNAKVGHIPKNSTQCEYHTATGVESLFGYLYLSNQDKRIKELFNIIIDEKGVDV